MFLDVCHFRRIVADNYHTITERSFRPLTVLNGTEAFPNAGKQAGSGFVRERPLHIPTFSDVSLLFLGLGFFSSYCFSCANSEMLKLLPVIDKD